MSGDVKACLVAMTGLFIAFAAMAMQATAPAHTNRLFCGKDNPINPCFTMESVCWFIPHDRALLFNGGYGWTLTANDWARLVEFAKVRGYEIPEAGEMK